jgi:hypothetical protein
MGLQHDIDFIRANHMTMPSKTISRALGRSDTYVRAIKKKYGIITPPHIIDHFVQTTRFRKGHEAHNKGRRMTDIIPPEKIHLIQINQFKPGHIPKNTLYDGAITIRQKYSNGEKYLYIRLAKAKWMPLHRHIWTTANGPIPKGYIIQFKDHNPLNCDLDNLYMISRADHAQICKHGGYKLTGDEKNTILLTYKILKNVREKQNNRS